MRCCLRLREQRVAWRWPGLSKRPTLRGPGRLVVGPDSLGRPIVKRSARRACVVLKTTWER
jgi:hypothetical protein